ncbi:MAG: ATP-binding cassette domain-containing protein [Christensenellales bacterium]|nr:ATP-binding cassette domain-containing protein [Christensenellales bacterium]
MPVILHRISKSFGPQRVITALSHTFQDNTITGVLGPSGCGKTTLLRLLCGLLQPDSGQITGADGISLAAVFQENRLMEHLSPLANIRAVLPGKFSRARITEALRSIGLEEAQLRQPTRNLSGGQKRRVALIRALLADAELLLMDEPLTGLDEDTRHHVLKIIQPYLKNRIVVWITHDPLEIVALGGSVLSLAKQTDTP